MMKYLLLCGLMASFIGMAAAQDAAPTLEPLPVFPTPAIGDFDEAAVSDIDLMTIPVLPEVTDTARIIYAQGQAAGRNPQVFAKVGDCMTASVEYFLGPYDQAEYDLGEHADLQQVIEAFAYDFPDDTQVEDDASTTPFGRISIASETGFNTTSVQDPIWSNPTLCGSDESPLACEYRLTQAAYALIMFGTNDVMFFEPDFFDDNLRIIVQKTIEEKIVPVLYTFPARPDFPEKTILFNQIIVNIAQEYDLPLVNLYAAVDVLPDHGIDVAQPTHLSIPPTGSAGTLTEDQLQYGYPTRNLLTLQTLGLLQTTLVEPEDQ